jgi:hypothetical protein
MFVFCNLATFLSSAQSSERPAARSPARRPLVLSQNPDNCSHHSAKIVLGIDNANPIVRGN